MTQEKVRCIICDDEAVVTFSPDLDVRGLGACENHRTDVQTAYGVLIYLGEVEYDEFVEGCRQKYEAPKGIEL